MKLKLPRRRWLLLIACLAAVAAISGSLLSGPPGRFTREQYDRIRLGMTPAEVASVMGGPARDQDSLRRIAPGFWDTVAEGNVRIRLKQTDHVEVWHREPVHVMVHYHDGKAVVKVMRTRMPPWKVKAREWLDWLRGLVGW